MPQGWWSEHLPSALPWILTSLFWLPLAAAASPQALAQPWAVKQAKAMLSSRTLMQHWRAATGGICIISCMISLLGKRWSCSVAMVYWNKRYMSLLVYAGIFFSAAYVMCPRGIPPSMLATFQYPLKKVSPTMLHLLTSQMVTSELMWSACHSWGSHSSFTSY